MQPARKSASRPVRKPSRALARERQGHARTLSLVHAVCCLAGCPSLIDDLRNELVEDASWPPSERMIRRSCSRLVPAFSYQGIADAIASAYMDRHGVLTWASIATDFGGSAPA